MKVISERLLSLSTAAPERFLSPKAVPERKMGVKAVAEQWLSWTYYYRRAGQRYIGSGTVNVMLRMFHKRQRRIQMGSENAISRECVPYISHR